MIADRCDVLKSVDARLQESDLEFKGGGRGGGEKSCSFYVQKLG
jgi:hypothetical protein